MADNEENGELQPIIVKKIKKGGGHHGGAWKVAYADFVTAMMAFFLLLWLLNVTTEVQRNAISNYFDPTHPKVSESTSGAGGVLGGLSMTPKGAMTTSVQNITRPDPSGSRTGSANPRQEDGGNMDPDKNAISTPAQPSQQVQKQIKKENIRNTLREKETAKFEEAAEKLKQAISENEQLNALSEHLMVDVTEEGLRIQILDQDGRSMFPSGSARMHDHTRALMLQVALVIQDMPNELSIRGHTDSVPFGPGAEYTNWELSSDRANSSRRVLLEAGLPQERLNDVQGRAATSPLLPEDTTNARNRRITIILLHQDITSPGILDESNQELDEGEEIEVDPLLAEPPPIQVPTGTFRRTPGQIQFP